MELSAEDLNELHEIAINESKAFFEWLDEEELKLYESGVENEIL